MSGKSRRGVTRRGALAALGLGGTTAACGKKPEAPRYLGELSFSHGVASGDPGPDRIVIWTRVTPQYEGPVPVRWVVARNRGLTDLVQTGVVETDGRRDYTVKVDVAGLRPGAPYFYGFLAGDQESTVGRTQTLKRGRLDRLRIVAASCASHPHGFFNVYEAIAREDDLDVVVHLGDYIYEYGLSGFGGDNAISLGRIPQPEVECLSLADYRLRHAQYKAERELQAAHAKCPWICVWDDHETANDCWMGGAENHNSGEGAWPDRRRAAMQAYYEWMPIRDPEPGRAFESVHRSFQFGDLATLIMLETRLLARTRPLNYALDLPVYSTPWDFSNPTAPRAMTLSEPQGQHTRMLRVPYEEVGGRLRSVFDWPRVRAAAESPGNPPGGLQFVPDRKRLAEMLNSPDRRMLGQQQEEWLSRELTDAKANDVAWQLIGNQVLMAPVTAPDLHATPEAAQLEAERASPGAGQLMQFTRFPIPLNPDSWDGYPHSRARLLDLFRRLNGSVIVLSGDSHAAWANELMHGGARVAAEFGAPSVTSPGPGDLFASAGVDFAAGVRVRNPHVKWTNHTKRGYLRLTLERTGALAEFMSVSDVQSDEFRVTREAAFKVTPGIGEIAPAGEEKERRR